MRETTLPSGRTAVVRPFTVGEQARQLARLRTKNKPEQAILGFLELCVLELDGEELPTEAKTKRKALNALLSEDRKALLLAIRRESLGDDFEFKFTCPHCNTASDQAVDLSGVEVKDYPHGAQKEVDLEVAGLKVRIQLLDGHAERRAMSFKDVGYLTPIRLRQPKVLKEGAEGERWVPLVVEKECTPRQVAQLHKAIKAAEGLVDTTMRVVCPECHPVSVVNLLATPDFFWPEALA